MKYTCSVDIAAPVDWVVKLFRNPDNLRYWQPGLISYEHLEGRQGEAGSKARMLHKIDKRDVIMTEYILQNDLPKYMKCSYEASGVVNIQETAFEPIDDQNTRYTSINEFRLTGFMKLLGWFMPGAFRKQTQKFMDQFKAFAESSKPTSYGIENPAA